MSESDTPPQPNHDELIAEYNAINEMARNDNTLSWTSVGLFFPTAVLVFGFVANHQINARPRQMLDWPELIVAALLSLGLWLMGFLIATRFNYFARIRFERARQIEEQLDFDHHRAIHRADNGGRRPWWLRLGVIGSLFTFGSVLTVTWVIAILHWQCVCL